MGAKIFNLPFHMDGLHLLSHHLHRVNRETPLALARTTVFLTTRRACRRLQSLLLQDAPCSSTILPRLIPFCDLGHSIQQGQKSLSPEESLGKVLKALTRDGSLSMLQALPLAKAFLDLEREGSLRQLDWSPRLETLFPDELASHRQSSLMRLKELITSLQDDLPLFPGALQAKALQQHISCWKKEAEAEAEAGTKTEAGAETENKPLTITPFSPTSPSPASEGTSINPVYGFGLHPKNDLERNFLEALAKKPQSMVWLSGLDRVIDDRTFHGLKAPHPQSGHAAFLKQLSLHRDQIPDWPCPPITNTKNSCQTLEKGQTLERSQKPCTHKKSHLAYRTFEETFGEKAPTRHDLGLSFIECQDAQEEARLISLALRHLVESPEKKALFVTPDSTLARSVIENLKRYDLTPDTGSGTPFAWTETGTFLKPCL